MPEDSAMASEAGESEKEEDAVASEADESEEEEEANSCIQLYYQVPAHINHDFRVSAILRVLESALYEEIFDSLRNKEQLGYYVGCVRRCSRGVYGISFEIESANYGPKHL